MNEEFALHLQPCLKNVLHPFRNNRKVFSRFSEGTIVFIVKKSDLHFLHFFEDLEHKSAHFRQIDDGEREILLFLSNARLGLILAFHIFKITEEAFTLLLLKKRLVFLDYCLRNI